ncbi:unnamed protein product [Prorocentrum cordatum]|uniref:Protein-serine/threonine phosphatase n=1 Tax=Prorocentrum cordatum TaxID=2364126 RepID=A0ABN9TJ32_9DINO|nr:unnamed protein product [Polarella glacialis]
MTPPPLLGGFAAGGPSPPPGSLRSRIKSYEDACRQVDPQAEQEAARALQARCPRPRLAQQGSSLSVASAAASTSMPTPESRSPGASTPPTTPEPRSPEGRGGAAVAPPAPAVRRPQRRLAAVAEQRVVKAGLRRIHRELVLQPGAQVAEMPRRIMRASASFLRRLVTRELELKVCMDNDVSGAQMDLKHLSLEQLLALRESNLGFACESDSHGAHRNFLNTADRLIFERLASRGLRGDAASSSTASRLQALGARMTAAMGAAELLEDPSTGLEAWTESPADLPALPLVWALTLGETDPGGCSCGLLHSQELWLEPLAGETPDLAGRLGDTRVAVASDHTCADRRVAWDFLIVDPHVDDVLAELFRDRAAARPRREHASELSGAVARRCAGRAAELGLPDADDAAPLASWAPRQPSASDSDLSTAAS